MWIDGALYACVAFFTFGQNFLTSDEAYKYLNPYFLFWLKFTFGGIGQIALALKLFRSTIFADLKNKQTEEPTP